MSPMSDPMTFDELSELYRMEMKSNSVTKIRPDFFRSAADLKSRLRSEYDKQMSIDPDSIMCEGANQHRKKADHLVNCIIHIRTQKICKMAIRGAMGGNDDLDALAAEEREYYEEVESLTIRHLQAVDRLRGRKTTVPTRIDEPAPPKEQNPPEKKAPDGPSDEDSFEDEPMEDFPEEPFDSFPDGLEDAPLDVIEPPTDDDLSTVVLRILEDLPPFVGPDRDYNLRREDVVTMPKVMADALVNVKKAAVVRPSP